MGTEDFKKYVKLMCESIDSDVDPSVDFIKYACGNFREDHFDRTQGNYLKILHESYYDLYDDVLLNETITYPSLVNARNFYKSYKKEFSIILKNKKLNEFCGTFPAFDKDWKSDKFDWVKASAILASMEFKTTMAYRYRFVNGQRQITISVVGPDDLLSEVFDKYEILKDMGVPEEKLEEIVADFNAIEKEFTSFTPKPECERFETIRKTYTELKDEKFDYCKFIETCLGDTLKEDDIFFFNNLEPGYFEKFTNMFEKAGPRAMANYITFAVSSQMIYDFYVTAMVKSYFAPAVIAAGFSAFCSKEVRDKRKEVILYFKKSLENMKYHFKTDCSWKNKWCEIDDEEVMKFIAANFKQEQIEKEYKDVEMDPDDFFKNISLLRSHGHTLSSQKTNELNIYDGVFAQVLRLLEFSVHFYNRPMFFYFSNWGFKMWYNHLYYSRIVESTEEVLLLKKCIEKQVKKRNIFNYFPREYEFLAIILSLQLSFRDFSNWIVANNEQVKAEEEFLQTFGLNCRKSFFVSFVQHKYWGIDYYLDKVLLALTNSEDFTDVFNCPTDSPMVEKDRYIINWYQ